ncbi:MAG: hypothetical protein Q8Q06_03995, partial [bacterium]|nr:hypothetical protein [bacterium]
MRFKVLPGRTLFITTLTGFLSFLALLMPISASALVSGSQILTDPIPNNFGCTSGSYFIVFLNGSTVIAGTSAPTEPADCSSLNGKIWSDVLGNGNDFHAYELNA